ncbi:MAG: SDR family oxidoreductase [Armatimonadetes bacterium]|nr:SDR family oxidoreductase [Armatimonadota bacterium]
MRLISPTVFVTGANRGLGYEFVRQFLLRGDRVYAGCRVPETAHELHQLTERFGERLIVVPLDLAQPDSIEAARRIVGETTDTLDILVNNAGTFATGERGLFCLDAEKIAHVFAVNAIAPALVAQQFAPLLERGNTPLVANLTSGVGVLSDRVGEAGGQYGYAASKAALNHVIRSLSFDLLPLGVTVIGIAPGYVQTDMTRGGTATLLPEESVSGMITVFDRMTIADTGRFFNYTNREDSWMMPG